MDWRNRKLVLLVFALCLVGVAGSGGIAAAEPLACDWEGEMYCREGCRDAYGDNYTGTCEPFYGLPTCVCWRWNWN